MWKLHKQKGSVKNRNEGVWVNLPTPVRRHNEVRVSLPCY
jgi:hypothetical protein